MLSKSDTKSEKVLGSTYINHPWLKLWFTPKQPMLITTEVSIMLRIVHIVKGLPSEGCGVAKIVAEARWSKSKITYGLIWPR